MQSKVSSLPTDRKPKGRLPRLPVRLGARMLPFYRPLVQLGPLQLLRRADGSLFWRWKGRRRHRLGAAPAAGRAARQRPARRQTLPPTRPS
ncbi:MAG: hypothetical protein CW349_08495 [Firmicutes bacterium]|nr:hypothetical protein [Bacillota bacterium]MBO2519716.1 hypothetical protein [Bacillota bacterium]